MVEKRYEVAVVGGGFAGAAAAIAAALALECGGDVRRISVPRLQELLVASGARID